MIGSAVAARRGSGVTHHGEVDDAEVAARSRRRRPDQAIGVADRRGDTELACPLARREIHDVDAAWMPFAADLALRRDDPPPGTQRAVDEELAAATVEEIFGAGAPAGLEEAESATRCTVDRPRRRVWTNEREQLLLAAG